MLFRVEIDNFLSIREPLDLDWRVGRGPQDPDGRFARIAADPSGGALHRDAGDAGLHAASTDAPEWNERVPRRIVLFGANASGKSTVLRAITLLLRFLKGDLHWDVGADSPFESFGTAQSLARPTRIRLSAFGHLQFMKPGPGEISYELQVTRHIVAKDGRPEFRGHRVSRESLMVREPGRRQRRIFERRLDSTTGQYHYATSPDFQLKASDARLSFIAAGRSALSVLASFNHSVSQEMISRLHFYSNVLPFGSAEQTEEPATSFFHQNDDAFESFRRKVSTLDLGIESVSLEQIGSKTYPVFKHHGLDWPLLYPRESEGTKSFYNIFPILHYAMRGGFTIVDEIDRDLHALALPEIMRWFIDTDRPGTQILATCHNPYLLEHLVKEEVVVVEKDDTGNTSAQSLARLQGTRRDVGLYARYLSGVFGGVPRIG